VEVAGAPPATEEMDMSTLARFEEADLHDELPAPGFYPSAIKTARLRRSASGNRMVHVVFALDGVVPGHDRVDESVPF